MAVPGTESWTPEAQQVALGEAADWLGRPMTAEDAEWVKELCSASQGAWRVTATAFAEKYGYDWSGNQMAGMDLWTAAQAILGEVWAE